MYQDTDFGREILIGTQDQAKAMGMKVHLAVGHKPRDTDFTGTITRMRAAGCDLVTMGTIIRDAIIPYATARKLGWKNVDFLATVASYSIIVAAKLKGLDGLYAMTSFKLIYPGAPGNSKSQEAWAADYKKRYGKGHNGAAQLGYIYADVMVEALKRAGPKLTMDKLVKGLESIKGFVTRVGNAPISFSDKTHQGAKTSTLAVVKGGRWVTISKPIGY
jgi:branched-chain amino acid transport system substrate-binding protein